MMIWAFDLAAVVSKTMDDFPIEVALDVRIGGFLVEAV